MVYRELYRELLYPFFFSHGLTVLVFAVLCILEIVWELRGKWPVRGGRKQGRGEIRQKVLVKYFE